MTWATLRSKETALLIITKVHILCINMCSGSMIMYACLIIIITIQLFLCIWKTDTFWLRYWNSKFSSYHHIYNVLITCTSVVFYPWLLHAHPHKFFMLLKCLIFGIDFIGCFHIGRSCIYVTKVQWKAKGRDSAHLKLVEAVFAKEMKIPGNGRICW